MWNIISNENSLEIVRLLMRHEQPTVYEVFSYAFLLYNVQKELLFIIHFLTKIFMRGVKKQ